MATNICQLCITGRLKLDELIRQTCSVDGINSAFDALRRGEVVRSVVVFP